MSIKRYTYEFVRNVKSRNSQKAYVLLNKVQLLCRLIIIVYTLQFSHVTECPDARMRNLAT